MAKLTKQEVKAIANKLYKELVIKINQNRRQAIKDYVPSQTYTDFKVKLDRIKDLENTIDSLTAEKDTLGGELNKVLDDLEIPREMWNWWGREDYREIRLSQIREAEICPPKIPTIEDLKDNITIAAIDAEFDVEEYIKNQLNKY